ncbi:type II toxin-antitoxin system HipA family toxin [Aliivibrio sp. S3MY1]|uniref:type II toxin-antitoxin system HipA family toxin n=1 Tax=unclassified Aliivibrio TaxID=2645654 RepID=UPI00237816C9|nr:MULTISPECIES: type II toxin-antitoxin system HipA family toxin [unclassified Aliivibrio]MDD9196723.1 type II toxin-antitoxin system HipA family toxin [Aliivibrio sp. S3MY1]MDD9199786.1 type II toxin-antitoxin system HipA family toxin [Aliivibrio sp. S2MY1]
MLNTPLIVKRTFADGHQEKLGQLAENKTGIYFQYDESYLSQHKHSIAPFNIRADLSLQKAPRQPHYGLHGVFGDSLPDGWGLYLMDRMFRNNGFNPQMVTALERLAYVGDQCLGALSYEPEMALADSSSRDIELITLGKEAVKEFEGTESHLIAHLMNAGGSGGARPKLNVTKCSDGQYSTLPNAKGEKLLIKLTSDKFDLKHSESLVEYAYMKMARNVGIEVPNFELVDASNGQFWLQQTRFDCTPNGGRQHMISACGLLDAPFREPSLDYVDLIKATRQLCGIQEAQKLVKRALFNYITVNQDDHSKNFAFLADDNDNWRLSPFYDIVYSPSPYKEHMTSFNGNGRLPTTKALELMAGHAGYANVTPLINMIEEIYHETRDFKQEALNLGISNALISTIDSHISQQYRQFNN